jgi:hypothetical protein
MIRPTILLVLILTLGAPAVGAAGMRTELITITAPDGTELDGAYYTTEGDRRPIADRKVVYLIHGRTMSFVVGLPRALPPVLIPEGYDALALRPLDGRPVTVTGRFGFDGVEGTYIEAESVALR